MATRGSYMYMYITLWLNFRGHPKNVSWFVFSEPITACYDTGKKKRLSYLVGNLVATNWPIEKALHTIGYNQIPTK